MDLAKESYNCNSTCSDFRVAAVQLVSCDSYEKNFDQVSKYVCEAANSGAQLVALPEYCMGYGRTTPPSAEEQVRFVDDFSRLAAQYNVWIVAGTFPSHVQSKENPYACCFVFDSFGGIKAQYNKIHLFDANLVFGRETYHESDSYSPGSEIITVQTPWGKLGLAICFDLRFAKMFSHFRQNECDFLVVPSAFTKTTGCAHWEVLVRARAIETQAYVIAPNQGGRHYDDTETWGESMIVCPWGKVINKMSVGEGYIIEDLDLSQVQIVRDRLPMAQSKKNDMEDCKKPSKSLKIKTQ